MKKIFSKLTFSLLLMSIVTVCMTACSDEEDELYGICEISGIVTDEEGNPLEGVSVQVIPAEIAAYSANAVTDEDGHYFTIVMKSTTQLVVIARAEGYDDYTAVLSDIVYDEYAPSVMLGKAKITFDIEMTKNK